MRSALALTLGLLLQAAGAAASDSPFSRYRTLSAPDCSDVSQMVVEFEPAPTDRTYLRVQHMGDPGSVELAEQVAYGVTFDAGAFTGLTTLASAQRGFVDRPGSNVFQVDCTRAGFYIDTATFVHASPLVGEGPNVSVVRDFSQPFPAFHAGASLLLEADVRAPVVRPHSLPVVDEGTAQISFFVYLRDTTTGTVITQLVALLDDRPPGTDGSGVEGVGTDHVNGFVSSPLAAVDGAGHPVRFVTPLAGSESMQYVDGWSETRHFAVMITPANFAAALERLRDAGLARYAIPSDYEVLSFGVFGEVIAGTGSTHEVALGASVANLALREIPVPSFHRP